MSEHTPESLRNQFLGGDEGCERRPESHIAREVLAALHPQLQQILHIQERIFVATQTGLTNLQSFRDDFKAFVEKNATDLSALTTTINNAIQALGASEDPAVQAVVNDLKTAFGTLQSNQTAMETLNASLAAAEAPAPAQNAASGS